jgi:hypothetical protein
VAVGIEAEEIAEGLHGDDGAGDGIVVRNRILEKSLQGFPGATAQIGKQLPVIQKVTAEDLRDAEDEMTVRDLLENIRAEPFSGLMRVTTSISEESLNWKGVPSRIFSGIHFACTCVTPMNRGSLLIL